MCGMVLPSPAGMFSAFSHPCLRSEDVRGDLPQLVSVY